VRSVLCAVVLIGLASLGVGMRTRFPRGCDGFTLKVSWLAEVRSLGSRAPKKICCRMAELLFDYGPEVVVADLRLCVHGSDPSGDGRVIYLI